MPQWLRIALLAFVALGIVGLIIYTFVRALRNSEDPAKLAFKWAFTVLVIAGVGWNTARLMKTNAGGSFGAAAAVAFMIAVPGLIAAIILAIMWGASIGQWIASPIVSLFDGGHEEIEPTPLYSIAEALHKRGRYRESLYAVQEQLQKFPTDFTGQMMVAEINAENLNDLQAAEVVIHRLCAQPNHPPANIAFALNTLADWQLKYAQDIDAARAALEKIRELLPETEFDRVAANRLAHLTDATKVLSAHQPATLKMKEGVEYLGLLKSQEHLLPKSKDPKDEARELVAHLDVHPMDTEARERLAVLYARTYGRLDFATEQLELLIALPGESPKHVARWLNLLADLQIELTGKTDEAESTLRRITELFPNHSLAELAEARMASLPLEIRRFEGNRIVKLSRSENA